MKGTSTLLAALLATVGCVAQASAGTASTPQPRLSKVLDDRFSPSALGLPRGGSLRWVWPARNLHPHNVRLVEGPRGVSKKAYRSPTRVRGFRFERAFPKPGDYEFLCTLHPFTMRQLIRVRR